MTEFSSMAQDFVGTTSSLVGGRTINIMDREGIIIASTERERIGTFHQGAAEVIATGGPVLIGTEDLPRYPGAKEGYNMPIFLKDELIGVVGIFGCEEQMLNVANLLKVYVTQHFAQQAMGLTILVGLLVSIPATLSALFYAKKVSSKIDIPANPEYTVDELLQKYGKLPGALHSFSPILLPILLIALKSVGDFPSAPFGDGAVKMFFSFIGNPVIALILGVFLPFIIAALLKTAMGASTVAMITTSAMIAPLMPALGFTSPLAKVLVIMAIGAGSMTVSHANDSYFWVVSQFSDMETKDAYKCQTGMTGVMGIVTIIIVFIFQAPGLKPPPLGGKL